MNGMNDSTTTAPAPALTLTRRRVFGAVAMLAIPAAAAGAPAEPPKPSLEQRLAAMIPEERAQFRLMVADLNLADDIEDFERPLEERKKALEAANA
jgi:hypothetical protein